jgi:hypothetical protein
MHLPFLVTNLDCQRSIFSINLSYPEVKKVAL